MIRLSAILLSAAAIVLTGCAGYTLGPTNGVAPGTRSIQVDPFVNKTLEPRLIEPVTLALRKRLQQDGTYRLATQHDGDIVVHGVITKFERSVLSLQPNDVITVQDYTLTLTAEITAVERSTGKTNLTRLIQGHTTVRAGNDLASAERQAVPLLADDLARNATANLADGSW